MAKVAWIGVGNMGNPMSQNLIKAGHHLTVYDILSEKCSEVVKQGASLASSAAHATEGADFIFIIVPNPGALLQAVLGEKGVAARLSPGQIVIDMSTVSIEASKTCNEAIEAKGCQFLRAPVNGSTVLAAKGELTVLCSGPRNAYGTVLPLFETLSRVQFYLGDRDSSRAMKLALNMMVGITSQMLAEAVVLCEKAGIEWNTAFDVIEGSVLASPQVLFKIPPLRERNYRPAFTTQGMAKDLGLALDMTRELGGSSPATALTKQLLESLIAQGRGGQDFASLLQLTEEMSGIES